MENLENTSETEVAHYPLTRRQKAASLVIGVLFEGFAADAFTSGQNAVGGLLTGFGLLCMVARFGEWEPWAAEAFDMMTGDHRAANGEPL
jgi:hypothetical protein